MRRRVRMARNTVKTIENELSKLAESMSFELVDVELVKEGQSYYLRIYIDKPGGITLNDCETYHRRVISVVESVEYDFLEVCSPGIDRPLKKEKDFERHMGDLVEVHLYKPQDGTKVFEGTLAGYGEDGIKLRTGTEERVFSLKEVSLCKPVIVVTEEDLEGAEIE